MAKLNGSDQVLVLAGKAVRVTHETVGIHEIRLDPDNPRIRFQLQRSGKTKPSQEDLQKFIKDQEAANPFEPADDNPFKPAGEEGDSSSSSSASAASSSEPSGAQ